MHSTPGGFLCAAPGFKVLPLTTQDILPGSFDPKTAPHTQLRHPHWNVVGRTGVKDL
ncbi:hypothetical protein ZHAS_00018095 [Anopheles sinensis]|uniref:Uncharacterized protein n=1 Tax=Anopheles sinensis TaxID=74873 RepID=A0A084WIK3_ANOSI|nr:hypothetical protein ZHAS_00018095 [Anopheles sinensis]